MPTQPGSPQAQMPPGEDALIRRIQELERTVREILPSVALSFGPVVADLADALATLTTAVADIAAQQTVLTELVSKVVESASNKSFNAGATVTTTRTVKATATVTVPAGFTKAQVWAFSDAMAVNDTALEDYLYVETDINAYVGGENYVYCQSGTGNSVSHTAVTALTGLTGGDPINCTVSSRTNDAPWGADSGNLWRIQAVVMFSR